MRYGEIGGVVVLAIASLAGCGQAPDGTSDPSVAETASAALGAAFTLHNYQTGLCLGVSGGNPNAGTIFKVWGCDGSANQSFKANSMAWASGYEMVNLVAADRCITTAGANGNSVYTGQCYSSDLRFAYPPDLWNTASGSIFVDGSNHGCWSLETVNAPGQVMGVSGEIPRGAPRSRRGATSTIKSITPTSFGALIPAHISERPSPVCYGRLVRRRQEVDGSLCPQSCPRSSKCRSCRPVSW